MAWRRRCRVRWAASCSIHCARRPTFCPKPRRRALTLGAARLDHDARQLMLVEAPAGVRGRTRRQMGEARAIEDRTAERRRRQRQRGKAKLVRAWARAPSATARASAGLAKAQTWIAQFRVGIASRVAPGPRPSAVVVEGSRPPGRSTGSGPAASADSGRRAWRLPLRSASIGSSDPGRSCRRVRAARPVRVEGGVRVAAVGRCQLDGGRGLLRRPARMLRIISGVEVASGWRGLPKHRRRRSCRGQALALRGAGSARIIGGVDVAAVRRHLLQHSRLRRGRRHLERRGRGRRRLGRSDRGAWTARVIGGVEVAAAHPGLLDQGRLNQSRPPRPEPTSCTDGSDRRRR